VEEEVQEEGSQAEETNKKEGYVMMDTWIGGARVRESMRRKMSEVGECRKERELGTDGTM